MIFWKLGRTRKENNYSTNDHGRTGMLYKKNIEKNLGLWFRNRAFTESSEQGSLLVKKDDWFIFLSVGPENKLCTTNEHHMLIDYDNIQYIL